MEWQLPAFGAALAFFHSSEFLIAALMDRPNLSARCELHSAAGLHFVRGSGWSGGASCCCCGPSRVTHLHCHAAPNNRNAALLFSKPYAIAMAAGLVEYAAERRWAPGVKQRLAQRLALVGLALLVAGELLRKAAMVGVPG